MHILKQTFQLIIIHYLLIQCYRRLRVIHKNYQVYHLLFRNCHSELIKYFDFPENFDFFLYKDKNDDLKKLNKLDLKKLGLPSLMKKIINLINKSKLDNC